MSGAFPSNIPESVLEFLSKRCFNRSRIPKLGICTGLCLPQAQLQFLLTCLQLCKVLLQLFNLSCPLGQLSQGRIMLHPLICQDFFLGMQGFSKCSLAGLMHFGACQGLQ